MVPSVGSVSNLTDHCAGWFSYLAAPRRAAADQAVGGGVSGDAAAWWLCAREDALVATAKRAGSARGRCKGWRGRERRAARLIRDTYACSATIA